MAHLIYIILFLIYGSLFLRMYAVYLEKAQKAQAKADRLKDFKDMNKDWVSKKTLKRYVNENVNWDEKRDYKIWFLFFF